MIKTIFDKTSISTLIGNWNNNFLKTTKLKVDCLITEDVLFI